MRRYVYWLLLAMLPALAYAGVEKHVRHKHWTNKYDPLFRKYTKHYFGPHADWHWFKAQGIAESGLRPNAKSPVGAIGLMQIMPATYKEIRGSNPFLADIREPRWNIAAGIYYDRMLYRKWKRKRDIQNQERLSFAFGSYNAGYGSILRAHKKAHKRDGKVKRWDQVEKFAPRETQAYVKRIKALMNTGR